MCWRSWRLASRDPATLSCHGCWAKMRPLQSAGRPSPPGCRFINAYTLANVSNAARTLLLYAGPPIKNDGFVYDATVLYIADKIMSPSECTGADDGAGRAYGCSMLDGDAAASAKGQHGACRQLRELRLGFDASSAAWNVQDAS
jgi:hypothetical protein